MWVYLTTVANDIEYRIIAGLLETADIPSFRKAAGIDEIIGISPSGIDVLVPEEKYEEARMLLSAQVDAKALEQEESETEQVDAKALGQEESGTGE